MPLPRRPVPLANALAAAVAVLAACGPAPREDGLGAHLRSATACPQAGAGAKLVRYVGGAPDRFIVAFAPGTDDVPGRAAFLTLKHGGRLLGVHAAAVGGFEVQLRPERADDLAREPEVCWVEQHANGT